MAFDLVPLRHCEPVCNTSGEKAREGREIPNERLNALAVFVRKLVQERGWVSDQDVDSLLAAGFTHANALEAVLAVTHKTLSNYANRVMKTPLDEAFESEAWGA